MAITAPDKKPDSRKPPSLFDWRPLIFTLFLFFIYYYLSPNAPAAPKNLPYSEFKQKVLNDELAAVQFKGQEVTVRLRSADKPGHFQFVTRLPPLDDRELLPQLEQHQVEIRVRSEEQPLWVGILLNLLPWILIFGFFVYSNRALQNRMGGGGGLFGFSRSKARLYEDVKSSISFDEVAGLDSAKRDLREVIDYLKNPDKFRKLGAKLPKGILMMGPPGTGKTLLAKATAAEAGVPFFSISGSEFVEMFVGVGAGRVRDMFQQASARAPALIFIDEIDSVGRVRGGGVGGGNDEREQTLNQILAEMDGFDSSEPVVVLAATNRPDVLDAALLRPGRFDRKITLELPQKKARQQILQVHTRRKPLAPDVDLEQMAGRTIGFSGADLENLVNEAALHAVTQNQESINQADFEHAYDKIILGDERQEGLGHADKKRVAIHESGHALMALLLPHADPLTKISIIPRGRALGVTQTLPEEDRINYTQDMLEARLCVLLGGRSAEKVMLGNVSSGAADDLKNCTRLARRMVAQWGMNEQLGPVNFPASEEHPFLGMEMAQPKEFSDATARLIDQEVENLVKRNESRALDLLQRHKAELEALANALLDNETLSADEARQLLSHQV